MSEGNKITINRMLPTVALRGMTVLPGAIIHFDLNREKSVAAIDGHGRTRFSDYTKKYGGQ